MGAVTTADVSLVISVPALFGTPQQIQGFASDDAFDIPAVRSVETLMGVDGVLSGGFVFAAIEQTISLQADSLSNQFFDIWWTQMQATKGTYPATAVIKLPSISTKYILNTGFLTAYKPAPPAKRILHPRTFGITWQSFAPAPS
jgi:hypothetical protein